jgi:hypothetical protein
MYTAEQLRKFKLSHLQGGGWYIDGWRNFTPESEVEERLAFDNGLPPPVVHDVEEPEPVITQPSAKRKRGANVDFETGGLAKPAAGGQVTMTGAEGLRRPPAVAPSQTESTVQAPTITEPSHSRLPTPSVSNIEQAAEELVRKRKKNQFPPTSSSVGDPSRPVRVFLENVCIQTLVESITTPSGPDPRWQKLHEFIALVSTPLRVLHFFFHSCNIFIQF